MDTEKRVIDMTAGEFAEVLYSVMKRLSGNEEEKVTNKRLVGGW